MLVKEPENQNRARRHGLLDLKEQEKDTRRKLILEAAVTLFARKDFRSVTVREIARAAGIGVGTIYNYYPNLIELFLDIFLGYAEEITRILIEEKQQPPPGLKRLCGQYITYLNDNMTFYQMMGHFMLSGDMSAEAARKLDTVMRPLMDRITEAVEAVGFHSRPRLTAHALFSALNGIMISYARYPGRNQTEIRRHTLRLADLVGDVFEKAPEPIE
jgi:AcrR family transcriptional regulator